MRPRLEVGNWKWSVGISALAIALIGCGGGGSEVATTGGGGGGTSGIPDIFRGLATVNLDDVPGLAQITFITGAGRDTNTIAGTLQRVSFDDNFGSVATFRPSKSLVLNRYHSQIESLNIPNALGQSTRRFREFDLSITPLTVTADGISNTFPINFVRSGGVTSAGDSITLPADIRIFPGRHTHIPIFLDDTVIPFEDILDDTGAVTGQRAVFDLDRLEELNLTDDNEFTLKSISSDYVAFDISAMAEADRPRLSDGSVATRVFFSGDGYALGAGNPFAGSAQSFEHLIPLGQDDTVIGRYSGPVSSAGATIQTPGTYSLVQANPSLVNPDDRPILTTLQGIWKDHYRQTRGTDGSIRNIGYLRGEVNSVAVAIPSSEDGDRQDVLFLTQTFSVNGDGTRSAQIQNLFWGYLDFETKTIRAYPIRNLPDINTDTNIAGEVVGTITGQFNRTYASTASVQLTQYVQFTMTSPPAGIPASGVIVVLRR